MREDVTVAQMVQALREENNRLSDQLANLVKSSTYDELFKNGPTNERGMKLVERIDENQRLIDGAEKYLSHEARLRIHGCLKTEPLNLSASAKRFLRDIESSVAFPVFDKNGFYCGSVFQRRNSTIRDLLIMKSPETIAELFRAGYLTDSKGAEENDPR